MRTSRVEGRVRFSGDDEPNRHGVCEVAGYRDILGLELGAVFLGRGFGPTFEAAILDLKRKMRASGSEVAP